MAMTTLGKGPETITDAGLAEIKPDNPAAIRKGLNQLRDYVKQSKAARSRAGAPRQAWMQGSEPERNSIWLVTYSPWSAKPGPPTHVRVFAHQVNGSELVKGSSLPGIDRLILSRRELPKVELPKMIPFPHPKKADLFGLTVESYVRDAFAQAYKRPRQRPQRPGRKGPDVLWRELEELFRELAEETGDGYWREVADELSSGV